MILVPLAVFVHNATNVGGIQEFVNTYIPIAEEAPHVINALASEPTRIRRRKPLLSAFENFLWDQRLHRPPQDLLTIETCLLAFVHLIFVYFRRMVEIV